MIDWTTAKIAWPHKPIKAGKRIDLCPDGTIESAFVKRTKVRGSYESTIQVRSDGSAGEGLASHLLIDGNPSKFLQGHNVFGSDSLIPLMRDTVIQIAKSLNLNAFKDLIETVEKGDFELSRIDINYSWELPSRSDVDAALRSLEYQSKTRHGRPSMRSGTLYWGQHSSRWALKAYSKGNEIEGSKDHRLPLALSETPIPVWADNKLRLELVLRSKELRERNLHIAKEWSPERVYETYKEYVARIDMSQQITLSEQKLLTLPAKLRSTYVLWSEGHDLRSTLSKNTYYTHRRQLLNDYDIDINLPVDRNKAFNVVPFIKLLEAKPAELPHWAFQNSLIHESARRIA